MEKNNIQDELVQGVVTNIQRYSIHDGPGVRSTVFLKGCLLRCPWCSNPECLKSFAEVGFIKVLCTECGLCFESCPQSAISANPEDGGILIDRARCDNCGQCVATCYPGALKMYGGKVSVAEVLEEVLRDKPIYLRSGGGVTVSGGEPLFQADFVMALFRLAHREGIHTAIETCGYVSPHIMKEVLNHTDYAMFDIKIMDSALHNKVIGKTNEIILENAKLLATKGIPVLPRMPLIPGINDTDENIRATAAFLQSLKLPEIEIMPFHRFASGKYEALGLSYSMKDVPPPDGEIIEQAQKRFRHYGVECKVSV